MGGLFMRDKMIVLAVIIAIVLVIAPSAAGIAVG
jgi:hypothetical protein